MAPLSVPATGEMLLALLAVLLAALLGFVAGWLAGRRAHRRRLERLRAARREEAAAWRDRLAQVEDQAERLAEQNARLEDALQARRDEAAGLAAAMADAAARDREELIRLQEELEGDRRIGQEKARLLRVYEAERHRATLTLRRTMSLLRRVRLDRDRQRAAVSALQAALLHAKRGLASAEERLLRLRNRMKEQAGPERIVEVPVERVVYRDREVPVEVPVEVPLGYRPFKTAVDRTAGPPADRPASPQVSGAPDEETGAADPPVPPTPPGGR